MRRDMAVPSAHTDRIWTAAISSAPRSPGAPRRRRAGLDDISVAICLLALVAVVVLGGLLALFSLVTAVLPAGESTACRTLEPCVEPRADGDRAPWLDPDRTPDAQPTR